MKAILSLFFVSNTRTKNAELLADWLIHNDIPEVKLQRRMNEEDFKEIKKLIRNGVGLCSYDIFLYKNHNGRSEQIPFDRYYMESAFGHKGDFDVNVLEIVNIDTSKPWILEENEGMELIRYLCSLKERRKKWDFIVGCLRTEQMRSN